MGRPGTGPHGMRDGSRPSVGYPMWTPTMEDSPFVGRDDSARHLGNFARGLSPPAGGELLCPWRLVVAKSTPLRFRLAAKTVFVPLLLLFPANPLRWALPGVTRDWAKRSRGRVPVRFCKISGAQGQECLPAFPSGPTGALSGRKFAAGAVPELRLSLPSQRFWPVFRRRGGYQPPAKPSPF